MNKLTTTLKKDALMQINEFESLGFAKSSRTLLNYIRNKKDINVRIFRYGTSARTGRKGRTRYSSIDIFGDRCTYIYYIEHKEDFVEFLVNKFLSKNPEPNRGIRTAFTRILHTNRLHWYGCSCIRYYHNENDKNKI